MDLREIKERSRAIWGIGDYGPTSRQLAPVSDQLVEALGVERGHRVLDVAAGHGNCALVAARRGAEVVASDFSPAMVERGRGRTQEEGLAVPWIEADAADLPFDDAGFDRVTSVFGAIFAPEQGVVAAELVRVTRPGGTVGITSWTVDGLIAALLRINRSKAPPAPEGIPDPLAWGDAGRVEELFAGTGCDLAFTRRTVTFAYPSWDAWRRDFEAHGLLVVLRDELSETAYEELIEEIQTFLSSHDHGEDGAVAYDAEYLEIQAHVPE